MPCCQLETLDALCLREAVEHARLFSDDPQTQNGALLITRHGHKIYAANRFPRGVDKFDARLIRPLKYRFMEHAERGAIFEAARQGLSAEGAKLYCPWFACADCARAIICAGVVEVIGHAVPRSLTPKRWKESVETADHMFEEAGIRVRLLDRALGVKCLFDGATIEF